MPLIEHIMADDPRLPPLERQVVGVMEQHPNYLFRKDKRRRIGRRVKVREGLFLRADDPEQPQRIWIDRIEAGTEPEGSGPRR